MVNYFVGNIKIEDITVEEMKEVSALMYDNFRNFPPYANTLSEEKIAIYSSLNTPKKLLSKYYDKKYIVNWVMKKGDDIIGYRLANIEYSIIDGKKSLVLAGKRLHVSKNFQEDTYHYYDLFVKKTEEFVLDYNYHRNDKITYITGVPSNPFVTELYKKNNFVRKGTHLPKNLEKFGIITTPLMVKKI